MSVSLHTTSWGDGANRRILLLHGIMSSAAGWWRVGSDLADMGWEVVAVDLRGHGDSPQPGSYGFSEYVEDVLVLGSGWDAVLGYSMGGTIAVLTSTAEPFWAKGLILQDPTLMLPEQMSEVLGWLLEDYLTETGPERIAEMNPRWHPQDVAAKVEKSSAEVVTRTVEVNWPWMVLDEASDLGVPAVVLGSDPGSGGILPVVFGEWLAVSSSVGYEMIPNSSHSAHRDGDQYKTYLSVLADALDRLPTLDGR